MDRELFVRMVAERPGVAPMGLVRVMAVDSLDTKVIDVYRKMRDALNAKYEMAEEAGITVFDIRSNSL